MNYRTIGSLKGKKLRKTIFYGHAIPYLEDIEIKGRFIVIEGPDASGRSTQIELLSSKLEADGHAVLNAGLRRSELIGQGILEAKRNFVLGRRTISLFYAADFADQLENVIIPALRSGFIVLADRYIYTLMARDLVRGGDGEWLEGLYSMALVPDAVAQAAQAPPAEAGQAARPAAARPRLRSGYGRRVGAATGGEPAPSGPERLL